MFSGGHHTIHGQIWIDQGKSASLGFCLFVAAMRSGDLAHLEPMEGLSALCSFQSTCFSSDLTNLSCCLMILRYNPRVSLTLASENSGIAEVRVAVMSQMVAAWLGFGVCGVL